MVDGDRVYPVATLFLHHSTGPEFAGSSALAVRDWYSSVGKDRGYQGGALNPEHEHPDRPGQLSYAMAQFSGHAVSGNKYGYEVIDLIKLPWQNVTWSVGDWAWNQKSVSIEICGNFLNKLLPEKALMCIADWLRPVDKELMGAGIPSGLTIMLHQEVYSTECPARLKEQRNTLVDMINNPKKWNDKLFPPAPVVTTKDVSVATNIPFTKTTVESDQFPKGTTRVTQPGVNGTKTTIYTVTYTDGKETKRVLKSQTTTKQMVPEITTVGTYEPPVTPPPASGPTDYDKEQDSKFSSFIEGLTGFLKELGRAIANFILSLGGK